jgi:membrane-associated phospholipid phosphatase
MKSVFYDWGGINVWLFHLINDIRFEWLDKLMLLGTSLGDHTRFPLYLSLLTLFSVFIVNKGVLDDKRHRIQVNNWMLVISVFSIAYLFNGLLLGYLKPLLDFSRPLLALPMGTVNVVGQPEYHHSLPSGHSSFAMLITASFWPVLNNRWRWVFAAFLLWVGISRVSLGAHFPADVMAGFLSSLAVVLLVQKFTGKLLSVWVAKQGLSA